MGEDDPPVSLEYVYIEDPYFPGLDENATPSLDDEEADDFDDTVTQCHWPPETEQYLRSLTLDQLLEVPDYEEDEDINSSSLIDPATHDVGDLQRAEAEFGPRIASTKTNSTSTTDGERFRKHLETLSRIRKIRFLTRNAMRDIKVTFVDLSKPYIVKISSNDNYRKFLNISSCPGR